MGAVSHDLRTPLASIKASVSDLADPDIHLDDEDRHVLLTTIEEETDRLTRLVSNLLDMGRIEAGALVLNRVATPIDELVDAVLARFTGPASTTKLSGPVSVTIDEGLPFLDIDYVMVEQVLTNLLENVVRHCPPGTSIDISVVPIGAWAEVRVADDGPGIAPVDRDRIFQLFYRAGAEGAGGTGMGLAICQGIVQAHGGVMWAERAPAGGSVFVFRLPLLAPEPEPPAPDRNGVDAHT
jgi:two-component system sensor histidine kinase KdpD